MSARADCLIALGSNLGDRLANLRAAVAGLADEPDIDVGPVSALYETAPVGGPEDQGAYYNAALRLTTTRSPADLLALLHQIEASRERERIIHWGPRTLDLDLLLHGDATVDGPRAQVPHPRLQERRFVLVPVCDVGADMVHPVLGRTMSELLAHLSVEPGDLWVAARAWHDPDHEPEWT